jgi:hypothetical protein
MQAALAALVMLAAGSACATAEGGGGDAPPRPDAAPLPDSGSADARADGAAGPSAVINEFVANHTSTDTCEYVEVLGQPGADLARLSVLVLDGNVGGNPGAVDLVLPVGDADASGRWVSAFLTNQIRNSTMTLLLVADFSGAAGNDLDLDDDGVLDGEPWSALLDAVAVHDGGASDLTYAGAAVLGQQFDGHGETVGGASRIPDGADTDSPADWVRNAFGGQGLGGGCPVAEPAGVSGEAINTPGAGNALVP